MKRLSYQFLQRSRVSMVLMVDTMSLTSLEYFHLIPTTPMRLYVHVMVSKRREMREREREREEDLLHHYLILGQWSTIRPLKVLPLDVQYMYIECFMCSCLFLILHYDMFSLFAKFVCLFFPF